MPIRSRVCARAQPCGCLWFARSVIDLSRLLMDGVLGGDSTSDCGAEINSKHHGSKRGVGHNFYFSTDNGQLPLGGYWELGSVTCWSASYLWWNG